MSETLYSQKKVGHIGHSHLLSWQNVSGIDIVTDAIKNAYVQGHADGANDLQIELIKRGKALFQIAYQKANEITTVLIECARESEITVYEFYLKIDNWDKITSLIIVEMDDYVDDKIDKLYSCANELAIKHNDESFNWSYLITYSSDSLNLEKIHTDGFTLLYENTPRPRKAQQGSM